MKRLANLKSNTNDTSSPSSKKSQAPTAAKNKKAWGSNRNNPYPHSTQHAQNAPANGSNSFSTANQTNGSYVTSEDGDGEPHRAHTTRSAAPTVGNETVNSDAGHSKAGTSATAGGALSSNGGGANSTFSSPNHSERSLTTTLTTIQSTAPSQLLNGGNQHPASAAGPAISPASAVPPHVMSTHLNVNAPHTYAGVTANNQLTDNASILTLASSSKRRRRNSLDTNASVRALAPSSVWGGSRESLPLSVLSNNMNDASTERGRPSVGGLASAERASVYSSSGVAAPALSSERNSYYASKTMGADGASVRSGLLGHGRQDSIPGSIGGAPAASSPLASPREGTSMGARSFSRRSSEWKDGMEGAEDEEEGDETEGADSVPEEAEKKDAAKSARQV